MKIKVSNIPSSGLVLEEKLSPEDLDLETEEIEFIEPIQVRAQVNRVTDVVSVDLEIRTRFRSTCSRCLEETSTALERHLNLHFPLADYPDKLNLDEDIRQELIVDFSVKFLCKPDCRGLCLSCGMNLNEGGCSC